MDSFDLLVINGLVVTASDTAHYDLAVKDGKIALLAPQGILDKTKAQKVIDAEGGMVMVGPSACLSQASSSDNRSNLVGAAYDYLPH